MAPVRKAAILEVFTQEHREKFWSKMQPENGDDCRLWLGTTSDGYGIYHIGIDGWRANRVAWVLYHGKEMGDLCACHSCDNRRCCNPKHIWAGTRGENKTDDAAKGRHREGTRWCRTYRAERLQGVPLADRSRIARELLIEERALEANKKGICK